MGHRLKKPENGLRFFSFIIMFLILYGGLTAESLGVEMIVNKSVPAAQYSTEDLKAIFTMKKTVWPNGKPIKVYTLADNHPLHKSFVKSVLSLFPHQLRRVWDRIAFSGTGGTPIQLSSEKEMFEAIAGTPDSIGYLDKVPEDENIRLLSVP